MLNIANTIHLGWIHKSAMKSPPSPGGLLKWQHQGGKHPKKKNRPSIFQGLDLSSYVVFPSTNAPKTNRQKHLAITGDMRMPKNVAPRAAVPHLQWDGAIVFVIEVEAKMMTTTTTTTTMMMMMNSTISIMMIKHCTSKGMRTRLNSTISLYFTLFHSTLLCQIYMCIYSQSQILSTPILIVSTSNPITVYYLSISFKKHQTEIMLISSFQGNFCKNTCKMATNKLQDFDPQATAPVLQSHGSP